jgi:serine kinase of HPr protein (carbohydrate metabolism regulator)
MFVHATSVALKVGRTWRAVLLRGPSGAGKSDVALRLVEAGGRLVADDQTHLAKRGRAVIASAPPSLAGLIEVRGIGIVKLGRGQLIARAPLGLLVDLVPPGQVERMPDPAPEKVLGIDLPRLALAAFEASIVMKLRLALARIAAP